MTNPVFELTLPQGYGYACVLRAHPTYGDILSIDPALHDSPLPEPVVFRPGPVVIHPLNASIATGKIKARHVVDVDVMQQTRLRFKFAVRDNDGAPIYWWLWDGDQIEIAGDDQDLSALPERAILTRAELFARWS